MSHRNEMVGHEQGQIFERNKPRVITPELLLSANRSPEAHSGLSLWHANKAQRLLTVISGCGDARTNVGTITDPTEIVALQSIAAAMPPEPFANVLSGHGVQQCIIKTHFRGDMVRKGTTPIGCGGQFEKGKLLERLAKQSTHEDIQGVLKYVQEHIQSPDPLVQSYLSASICFGCCHINGCTCFSN
jgi:hypothetical protein